MRELTLRELTDKVNEQEKLIKESERTFKAIFCINPVPMVLASIPEGQIIIANDAFYETSEWTPEEAMGKTMQELGIYDNPADRVKILTEARAKGFVKNMRLIFRNRHGHRFYSSFSAKFLTIHDDPHFLAISIVDMGNRLGDDEVLDDRRANERI
jgi:PAS domain S-box-containing protein